MPAVMAIDPCRARQRRGQRTDAVENTTETYRFGSRREVNAKGGTVDSAGSKRLYSPISPADIILSHIHPTLRKGRGTRGRVMNLNKTHIDL